MSSGFRNKMLGASLGCLLAAGASHAALALPSGAVVKSGQATVSLPSNGSITIAQGTNKAIIDWSTFSIAANQSVFFANGGGATLNRVAAGAPISSIDGLLSATGSVYLINPNGVIIGTTGVVNVGGRFVASTLDVVDADFQNGGALTFNGTSGASVVNLGAIGASGGDVVLIASKVQNTGAINAPKGDIGLLAGTSVLIRDNATDDGKFAVQVVSPGAAATNSGALQAAMVELRANGGNVYALAGNTAGLINATGVSTNDGKVFLTAGQGYVDVQGVINATHADGSGGEVTTAGSTVGIAEANIGAGMWTLQQDAFVLTPTRAAVLSFELPYTAITIKTIGADGGPSGGDITLPISLSWAGANSLTLTAHRNVVFQDGASLSSGGGAGITLQADDEGRGRGTVSFGAGAGVSTSGAVTIFYNPTGNDRTSVNTFSYADPTNYAANVSAGSLTSYMWVNTVYDLQNVNNDLAGTYALGRNINFNGAALTGATIGDFGAQEGIVGKAFTGTFDGFGHSISNMTTPGGLFGYISGGVVENLSIKNETLYYHNRGILVEFTAAGGLAALVDGDSAISNILVSVNTNISLVTYVGGLVGYFDTTERGTIIDSSSSGSISGAMDSVGGLVGAMSGGTISDSHSSAVVNGEVAGGLVGSGGGTITSSYATGAVSGGSVVGGLVGSDRGTISNSYATGAVSGETAGGLVGYGYGTISNSYASGSVSGTYDQGSAGGFVGENDSTITNAYATGAVTGSGNAGGFAGANYGSISTAYATGSVAGGITGGFVGVNSNDGTIARVYATGPVSSGGGGLAGEDDGSIINAYWDVGTTGQSQAVANVNGDEENLIAIGGATGLDPYQQSTYKNFNFGPKGEWTIVNGVSRPTLKPAE